jgi:hypothetical protein
MWRYAYSGTQLKRQKAMASLWRNFPLVFTVAAAVVTPAFGQAAAPTVGPAGSEEESASSIPDFSGIWVHSIPGFEPLRSGPTALVNRSRRENGTGDILKLTGDYTNPILKPEAAEVVKSHAELGLNGIGDPNPRIQCRPGGVPFVFTNGPTELLQQPDRVTILYSYDHQVRRVPLNQSHPADVTLSCSPMTSRSNWANNKSTLRVRRPMLLALLKDCVTRHERDGTMVNEFHQQATRRTIALDRGWPP